MNLSAQFRAFAHRPGETDEAALHRKLILAVALLCSGCGLVWSMLYGAVFGFGLVMALPLAFVVIVGGAIVVSAKMADHRPLVYAQLACITWISALIQWSIGSASASGLVICWSFLGPIGALIFLPFRKALVWMGMFVMIVVISALDPALLGAPLPVSEHIRALFLAMNMGVASMVVFAAAAWFVLTQRRALSDLKAAQARLVDSEKQAVLGRLVSGILHEMNSPLGAIRSTTALMGKALARCEKLVVAHGEEDDPNLKRALRAAAAGPRLEQIVDTSVDRLSAVVDGLAQFVCLDEAESKPIDVRQSLDTAIGLLADTGVERIAVQRRYGESIPQVLCFPARLNQVFLNVLQNAVQAIEDQGDIQVRVSASDDTVDVVISDTGRGISADRLADLFEIGFSDKSGRVGMQLGLPTCKRHLDEIEGQIHVDSAEGVGTTVHIAVPAAA